METMENICLIQVVIRDFTGDGRQLDYLFFPGTSL